MENKYLLHLTLGQFRDELVKILEEHFNDLRQPTNLEEKNMTRKEVAEYLKITLPTLHEWSKNGTLKPRKIQGRVYYRRSEIEHLFENIMFVKHSKTKAFNY